MVDMIWKWLNDYDAWWAGLEPKGEAMWVSIIEAVKWSWAQMTLLSTLILIMIIAIAGLVWLQIADRKKLASKAYWRGWKDGKG